MPILFYGLEVCPVNKSHITRPAILRRYFARTHRKLSLKVVMFNCVATEDIMAKRKKKEIFAAIC